MKPVAVLVVGRHLRRPAGQSVPVGPGPGRTAGPGRCGAGGQEERRVGVERVPRRPPGDEVRFARLDRVADQAVALGPGQVAVDRHPDEVHGGQAIGQLGGGGRHQGVHVEGEGDGVAGGVVGQHLDPGVDLEEVEEGAAEAVVARVGLDALEGGMDGRDLERVFDFGPGGVGGREGDFDEGLRDVAAGVVVQGLAGGVRGDPQRAHVRHVQDAGQGHAPLARLHPAEQGGVIFFLVDGQEEGEGIDAGGVLGPQDDLLFGNGNPPEGSRAVVRARRPVDELAPARAFEAQRRGRPGTRVFL